jgi:hypothetical protein
MGLTSLTLCGKIPVRGLESGDKPPLSINNVTEFG